MSTNHKDLKQQSFPTYSMDEWMTAVNNSLKNKSMDALYSNTYENIRLKPLYSSEDLDFTNIDQYSGSRLRIRGFDSPGDQPKTWRIAQKIKRQDWAEVKKILKRALENGQDSLSFDVDYLENVDDVNFSELNNQNVPYFLLTKHHFHLLLKKALEVEQSHSFGIIAMDLISCNLHQGKLEADSPPILENWSLQVLRAHRELPNIKTILIDTTPFHNGGANAVQELALALAEAIFYIEHMRNKDWEPSQVAKKLVFHFGIGGNFFMEVAKLRAFRALWTTVARAYGISPYEDRVVVSAETSTFTKTVLDPYVNMLRSGNEAFSAIIGGIDYLHVSPYDEIFHENGEFSARIARNTQLILQEEAHLKRIVDPAGGSYYIESLTNELVEKAWELFQKIDALGGIVEGLKSGWIQNDINQVLNKRLLDVETRKHSVIGANVYANPSEQISYTNTKNEKTGGTIIPITSVRIAQAFENLRERAHEMKLQGKKLCAGLICLGELKDYKSRADFVTGVLATGGITTDWGHNFRSFEEIKEFISTTKFPYYCICGTDDMYKDYAMKIGEWVQENYPAIKIDISGKFTREQMDSYCKRGISDSIYLHQNMVQKITSLLNLWEV
ncbi:methylmalonyl-CoA mutase family protein [Heyndrickxia camelliae]|uniref:methylmalonyl-CoA mutase n=1 Tax=Heyndrickxia camelliae TaxID=1707093 RepID=A0A2N3LN48_9BACI|nr:methylmalonyl-CoA mutase family protein [Heyndrickxia camelliae]PKR86007.1 methylmalonyl-CoA mutase [Heyndrickxia camelliae]